MNAQLRLLLQAFGGPVREMPLILDQLRAATPAAEALTE
jgi:hypothetical protein